MVAGGLWMVMCGYEWLWGGFWWFSVVMNGFGVCLPNGGDVCSIVRLVEE